MKYNKKPGSVIVSVQDLKSTFKSTKYFDEACTKYGHLLPIFESVDLAKIVACLLTDGFIDIRTRYKSKYYGYIGFFSKFNYELEEFGRLINSLFGLQGEIKDWRIRKTGHSRGYIIVNSFLLRILHLAGVPGGEKVNQEYNFPRWILCSNNEIKAAFIRQIFDCEGTIGYDKYSKRWEIRYSMYKSKGLKKNCIDFLNCIRGLLESFRIESRIVKKGEYIRGKDGIEVIGFNVRIDERESIISYNNYIGFNNLKKKNRLKKALDYYEN